MNKHVAQTNQTQTDMVFHTCIWMSAGVISYKLCPHNFNCDGCEFDAAMRRMQTKAAGPGNNRAPDRPPA